MVKQSILDRIENKGSFLVIGKNSYNIAKKICGNTQQGVTIFHKVNTLQTEAQRCFYSLIQKRDKIIIGTIEKDLKLPNVIKQNCMVLRLKNEIQK